MQGGPVHRGHLPGELMRGQVNVDVRHVPYRGQADAITAVIRGDVAFAFVTVPATLPHVKAGASRPSPSPALSAASVKVLRTNNFGPQHIAIARP